MAITGINNRIFSFKSQKPETSRTVSGSLKSLFYAIPKTELHVHLGGAYPKHVVRDSFKRQGSSKTEAAKRAAIPDKFERLDRDFIPLYSDIAKIIENRQDLEKATYETLKQASEDNVKYMELKISNQELNPQELTEKDLGSKEKLDQYKEKMYESILKATREAEKDHGIKVKYIFTLERHFPSEHTLEDAKFAVKLAKKDTSMLIALDLAGDEYNFPVTLHEKAIKHALDNGIENFTPHAGESPVSGELSDVEAMKNCIAMGAKRIGHGLAVIRDKTLMKLAKEKDIAIEVSPTSNVMLGVVDSYENHPVKKMLDEDIKVTLCTDDPTMFNTKLTKEFEHLYRAGVLNTWDEVKKISMNGVNAAFLPENEKNELKEDFKDEFQLIEDSPFFKEVIDKYLTPDE